MSGFTALNSSSPKAVAKLVADAQNGNKDEHVKVPAPTPAPVVDAAPAPVPAPVEAPAPVQSPAAEAQATTPVKTQAPAVLSPSQRESWPTQGLKRTPPTAVQGEAESLNKRRHSDSTDGRTQLPTQPAKRAQRAPDRTQERTPETATVASHQQPNGHYENGPQSQSQFQGDEKGVRYAQSEAGARQHAEPQAPPPQSQATPPSVPIHSSAEQQPVQRQPEYVPVTPQNNNQAVVQKQSPSCSEPLRSGPVVEQTPKKRKRNFSNRTKTGCLTCRRRKKKCDEAKPECNNCIKGGFECAGYPPQRGAGWPKINNARGVPLESKDPNYVPCGAYGMPASPYTSSQAANNGQPSGVNREPLPQYRGQNLRIEPPKRPDGPGGPANGAMTGPERKLPLGPYTPGANPYPTPVSANNQPPAFGDRAANDYQRHRHAHAPLVSSAQMAAQMALSHAQVRPHSMAVVPHDQRHLAQREEMLQGGYFYQNDAELCMERDRAATACWRFNSLTYPPANGVSTEERARLFLEILQPRDYSSIPIDEASGRSNVGCVGRHVAVESPFNCDYGYNISIGNNVVIGKGCTMNDAGKIQIGDNCIIGPNVSMYTIELSTDPKHRQGGHGTRLGKGIIIDSDCWIGGGVIIMPGKVVGKGSTVGAGSVVTKDVPPFTIVAGNPARVLRGVASL